MTCNCQRFKKLYFPNKLQGKQARVLTSYTLTPYIYKEDTIMYIANYEDGWETHQLGINWGIRWLV